MASPQINGEVTFSATIDHLLQYPAVNDGVNAVKQNYYGQRSLSVVDRAYQTFAAPILPYFKTPYSFVQPYVRKADEAGDWALNHYLDERFPAIRQKAAGELYADTKNLVLLPYTKSIEGKNHVFAVYNVERKKQSQSGADAQTSAQENGGAAGEKVAPVVSGVIVYGKAFVTTALIVTGETVDKLNHYLNDKKEQAQAVAKEATEKNGTTTNNRRSDSQDD